MKADRPVSTGSWSAAWTAGALMMVIALPAALSAQQDALPGAAARQAAPVVVDAVVVQGNERQPTAVIRAEAGIAAGDTIRFFDIQTAIRGLWATGQFSDVRIFADAPADQPTAPVTLVIQVVERPYVATIDFRGLEHISAGTIRDTVGLVAGGPIQPAMIAATEHMIRRLLAEKGFRVDDIQHTLEPIPDQAGSHHLIFNVDEGRRIAIAAIEFKGNDVFSDARLRDVMAVKAEGFFWFRDGIYQQDRIRKDLREKLPGFYGENGFIDFAVAGDTLIVDPETGKARLIIEVREGPRYQLAAFDIQGNETFSADILGEYFSSGGDGLLGSLGFGDNGHSAESGSAVFDRVAFREATAGVQKLYRDAGYLYARVRPVIERVETESGEPAVRATWYVQEGEPAYVHHVAVEGNTYTHESVIRSRILLLPGDVYSQERLLQSYRRIAGLGFFKMPMPMPEIQPRENGDVDITFKVEEQQTGSVNFGTAIGGWAGISGFLGYDQPNLFGQAKSGHLRWEFGRFINNFEGSYSDPGILGSRISGSTSLFSTRGSRYFRFRGGTFRRTGGSLQLGVPVPFDPWTRFTVGYSLFETSYDAAAGTEGSEFFNREAGTLSTVTFGLLRTTLNHPLFPTSGARQSVQAEVSGGILGGDGQFQKYSLSGSWYIPVGEVGGGQPGASAPLRFTLGLSLDAGAIFGDQASLDRFPFERFLMGGVRFGESLRGYSERSITPVGFVGENSNAIALADRFGNAYLRLSAEYAVRFNNRISVALFYDAGNVWADPSAIHPARLFRGAGIGATVVTPFGPLGLDYAYGFDKPVPGWQLHFKFGPAF